MLTHHTSECPKSSLNAESHWLDNGSFLLTESFCEKWGKVGYSRHIFAFSKTATLFQVQTSSKFVKQ